MVKTQVTSASTEFATTNGDRSTELTESFLLVDRYLDFDNGLMPAVFDGISTDRPESLLR